MWTLAEVVNRETNGILVNGLLIRAYEDNEYLRNDSIAYYRM